MSYTDRILESMFKDRETTCAVCGRTFYRAPDHKYKATVTTYNKDNNTRSDHTLYFCRYNHYVQWLKDRGRW